MTQTLRTRSDETRFRGLLGDLGERCRAWRFEVAPNPCVGAALLSGDDTVAEGFHRAWGGPHAEVNVLAAAQGSTGDGAGADPETLLVTLEPCSSTGKTGPCTRAVLQAGLSHVVVGELDPDPRHRGAGIEKLIAAGLQVDVLPGSAPLREVAPHFLRWTDVDRVRRPRPWVIAKWAQTRTGQLVPPADVGEGRWISSAESLAEVQELRGRVDAILTGVGTVRADDPRFSLRSPAVAGLPAPLRVVLDTELRTPPDARLFAATAEGERAGPVHVLCRRGASAARHRALVEAGAEVHGLRLDREGVLPCARSWSGPGSAACAASCSRPGRPCRPP